MSGMNNLKMAMEAFEDEIDGVMEYKRMHDESTDPALKKIFLDHMAQEKKHASNLIGWVNAASAQILS